MASQSCAACFAVNLKRCRAQAGLSQEEVGFRAELHRTEVGLLERGARVPRIDTVIKLATALEVDAGELLAGIVWTPAGRAALMPQAGGFSHSQSQAKQEPAIQA
jgi:transcriptional regulator with XRE-family HTH domain